MMLDQPWRVQSISNTFEIVHKMVNVGFDVHFSGKMVYLLSKNLKESVTPKYFVATGIEARGLQAI